jgi:Aminotransferase class-V
VAEALNEAGVESRAGCHCATLAHHALGLTPPASCRLSFYLYNTPDDVDHAVAAVSAVAAGRRMPAAPRRRFRSRWPVARPARWQVPVASLQPPWAPEENNADHTALRPLQEEPSRVLG